MLFPKNVFLLDIDFENGCRMIVREWLQSDFILVFNISKIPTKLTLAGNELICILSY